MFPEDLDSPGDWWMDGPAGGRRRPLGTPSDGPGGLRDSDGPAGERRRPRTRTAAALKEDDDGPAGEGRGPWMRTTTAPEEDVDVPGGRWPWS